MDEANDPLPPSKGASKLFWIALLVIAGAVLLFSSRNWQQPRGAAARAESVAIGQPLPFAYFEPLTGAEKPLKTEDLQGRVVLINYWGPWCHFCALEFPELVELEKEYRANSNFLFVSVASDGGNDNADRPSDLAASTAQFLERYHATFPTYVDRGGRNRSYLVTLTRQQGFGYPCTVLVDRSGTIADIWPGYDADYGRQMKAAVAKALTEKPDETPPEKK